MEKRSLHTPQGTIVYWTNYDEVSGPNCDKNTCFFLPGLTADHRLFQPQFDYFSKTCNCIVWDAPGHAESRPFELNFSLQDKAKWVYEILQKEGLSKPILIGQSMGGYVSQAFIQQFPGVAKGFVCIDSAPLQRQYYSGWELWALKRTEPMYKWYPHGLLVKHGASGCSETEAGRALMKDMISGYEHNYYAALGGHGFRILAEAVELELPYEIDCPALLLCGEYDKAGSAKSYNKRWTAKSGIPLVWVKNAGHNANCDQPEFVNEAIERFIDGL